MNKGIIVGIIVLIAVVGIGGYVYMSFFSGGLTVDNIKVTLTDSNHSTSAKYEYEVNATITANQVYDELEMDLVFYDSNGAVIPKYAPFLWWDEDTLPGEKDNANVDVELNQTPTKVDIVIYSEGLGRSVVYNKTVNIT
ncbi:MAG: hypothetical protein HZC47_03030 [Methanobacterium sp.]|uniref:hypothetical protein n=1 Tax=Methanobacterium sp. TaxID=2164 RepID=UPI003D64FCBA|nr:hypothetical protein [Methanobacterium sp.]